MVHHHLLHIWIIILQQYFYCLQRIDYDPDRTIVGTIGLLYIIQQVTLMTFGPEARPVEAPFNQRLAIPWFEFGENCCKIDNYYLYIH